MDLLKKTGEDSKFRAALSNALSAAANDVLMKKVSIKKKFIKKLNKGNQWAFENVCIFFIRKWIKKWLGC